MVEPIATITAVVSLLNVCVQTDEGSPQLFEFLIIRFLEHFYNFQITFMHFFINVSWRTHLLSQGFQLFPKAVYIAVTLFEFVLHPVGQVLNLIREGSHLVGIGETIFFQLTNLL